MSKGHNPLQQFEISPVFPFEVLGVDLSFTNASAFMLVAIATITSFMVMGMRRAALVPGRFQSMVELSYEFVAGTVRDTVGAEGRRYFPFVFSVFMFVLFANLIGMVPYSFTVTSHIVVTFAIAFFIFLGVTAIGFARHGLHFFHLVVPQGLSPVMMATVGWLIVLIEAFSYLTRPVTLSIRLAANMTAGHVLLKVIAGFVGLMGVFGIAPLLFMTVLIGFEIFVAILQAYIFTVLTCVYLNDAVHMH